MLRSRKYGKNVSPISTHFPIYFVWKLRIRNESNLIIIILFFLHFIVQCLKICDLSDYMSNDQKARDIKVIQNRRKLRTKFYEELRHKTCDCLVEVCFIYCVKFCQTTNTNEIMRGITREALVKKSPILLDFTDVHFKLAIVWATCLMNGFLWSRWVMFFFGIFWRLFTSRQLTDNLPTNCRDVFRRKAIWED